MRRLLLALVALAAFLATPAAAEDMLGEQRVLVLLVTWGPEPFAPDHVREVVFQEADAWFRDASYGRTSLAGDVTPWLHALPADPACNQRLISRAARDAATRAGYDLRTYVRFVFVHPRTDCPFAGQGSGEQAFLNGSLWSELVIHELGHTYGLGHANTWECAFNSCRVREYGNPYSVMGNGFGHFTAYEKVSLSWLPNVTQALEAGDYELHRLELPTAAPQAIRLTTARNEYWLEYRAPAAATAGHALSGGVLVNAGANPFGAQGAAAHYGQYNLLLPDPAGRGRPTMAPGESFREAGAFQITVESADDQRAVLKLSWLDTQAPVIPRVNAPRSLGRRELELSWEEARETGSGVVSYLVSIDGRVVAHAETELSIGTAVFVSRPNRGRHTLSVVAIDRAGNRSAPARRAFTIS